jgi:hypothetical protein
MEQTSKDLIKLKIDEENAIHNKLLNVKGKQLSFSQESEISEDTKENHKFFSPVSLNIN